MKTCSVWEVRDQLVAEAPAFRYVGSIVGWFKVDCSKDQRLKRDIPSEVKL